MTVAEDNPPPPAPPTNVAATPVSATEIDLSWAAVSGATYYSFTGQRCNPPPPLLLIRTTTATIVKFTGLTPSTTYCFGVQANNDDVGSPSVGASASTS